jgi:hypothetical protein
MAAALLVVAGAGVWSVIDRDASESAPPAIAATAPPSAPTVAPPVTPAPTVDAERDAVASVEEVTLTVRAVTDRSWLSVTGSDGVVLFEGILEAGQRQSVSDATELRLVIGNAGAVALTVNGEDQGLAGDRGQVARLTIGPYGAGGG